MPNPYIPHRFGAEHHRFQQLWESLTSSQAKLSSWQELPGSQGFLCPCFPKYLAGIPNKQIFPQTSWPVGTGCEQLPTKTSSSFRPLRPWLVPQSPGQGRVSPTEGWHRLPWQQMGQGGSWKEKWGGGSVGEGNLGISEWRQAGIGAGAAGDDGTGTSQPCPKGRVRQDRWEGKSAPSSGENSPRSYF